jgi:ribosomal protein S18 acetylase RimI-like enzyme
VSALTESARLATADDVDRIAALAREAIAELRTQRGGELWSHREARAEPLEAALRAAVDDEGQLVLVGTVDDTIVGYAVARREDLRNDRPLAVIDDLYVEHGARDVGVGEALMDAIIGWSRQQGCTGIDAFTLPGNRETKNFFESHGLTARAILVHRDLDRERDDSPTT